MPMACGRTPCRGPLAPCGTVQIAWMTPQSSSPRRHAQDHVAEQQRDGGGPPGVEQVGAGPGARADGKAGGCRVPAVGMRRRSRCDIGHAQRSTSAMCALYQFMNRLIDRLNVR